MRRKHLSKWAVSFIVLGLLLLVTAGCGSETAPSSDGSPSSAAVANLSAEEIVAQSNTKMAAVTSGSFTADMGLQIQGDTTKITDPTGAALLSKGITMHAEGKSASDPVAMDMDVNLSLADQALALGLLAQGDKMWVSYQDQWYVVDQKNSKALSTQAQTGAAPTEQLKSFGLDPAEWGTAYTLVGTEDAAGTPVYHVQATADPQKLAAALTKAANDPALAKKLGDADTAKQLKETLAQSKEQTAQLQKSLKNVTVDYWIGVDDMLMRKAEFTAALGTAGMEGMEGVEGMTMKLTVTMGDFNEPVTVEAPANAKSIDTLMEQMLGGMSLGI
jgi:hypothetical protein